MVREQVREPLINKRKGRKKAPKRGRPKWKTSAS
jgi:hypothetical protein